jgi:hypothetical protein
MSLDNFIIASKNFPGAMRSCPDLLVPGTTQQQLVLQFLLQFFFGYKAECGLSTADGRL